MREIDKRLNAGNSAGRLGVIRARMKLTLLASSFSEEKDASEQRRMLGPLGNEGRCFQTLIVPGLPDAPSATFPEKKGLSWSLNAWKEKSAHLVPAAAFFASWLKGQGDLYCGMLQRTGEQEHS